MDPEAKLTALPVIQSHTAWYKPSGCSRDVAQQAFEDAVTYLQNELKGEDVVQAWIESPTTMDDIIAVVQAAKTNYDNRAESRKPVLRWLSKVSSRIMYYAHVLDVLAQHHPEYVALAWGAMKFVLIGVINHEALVVQLSQALTMIGDVLPRTKLNAELYQTQYMREAISRLYAHIILFIQQTIKWYSLGPAGRVFSSIIKPFGLDYKDTVEQIKICSQTVDDIASAAVRAEIRDINVILQLQRSEFDRKLQAMQTQLKDLQGRIDASLDNVLQVALAHKAITETVHVNVCDIQPRIYEIQFSEILASLKPAITPEESLAKCQSVITRSPLSRSTPNTLANPIRHLSRWIYDPVSSIFLVRSGPRAEPQAKQFALGVINALESTSCPVIWHLSPKNTYGHQQLPCTLGGVFRSLIFQILRRNPHPLLDRPDEIRISHFQDNHTDSEWLELLCTILSKISQCFIVLEVEEPFRDNTEHWELFRSMVGALTERVAAAGGSIRLLLFCSLPRDIDVAKASGVCVTSIKPAQPIPPRLRPSAAAWRRGYKCWRELTTTLVAWYGDRKG